MWELIFMMLILKIPVVYLAWVVYWAIKSEPLPEEPAALSPVPESAPDPGSPECPWSRRRIRPRPPRPSRRSGARAARRTHAPSHR